MKVDGLFGDNFLHCGTCGLYRTCKTPRMKPSGKGKFPVLVVGEAPGKLEDEKGVQFVGESGKLVRWYFEQFGFNMNDFRIINAVNCRPPRNATPTVKQIRSCFPMVKAEIDRFKPNLIFLFGDVAVTSLIGDIFTRSSGMGIGGFRGFVFPDQKYKAWLAPMYHPSFLLRNRDGALENVFISDMENALKYMKKKVPDYTKLLSRYEILTKPEEIHRYLMTLPKIRPKVIAFDYETNSLKPYCDGKEIKTVSICYSSKVSTSFPIYTDDKKTVQLLNRILANPEIKKIGANMKFEQNWSRSIFGVKVKGWVKDIILQAHVDDNRPGITSLKFQVYKNFGIGDYEKTVQKNLGGEYGTSINKIDKIPMFDLLKYNALDSLFTFIIGVRMLKRKEEVNDLADVNII